MNYQQFKWRGQDRYKCSQCEFDTYSVDGIEDHIRDVHKAKNQKAPVLPMPILFDEHGKRIPERRPDLKQVERPNLEDYE